MNEHHSSADDYFEPTRMPLGNHLEELRRHLWRAVAGFAAIVSCCFLLDLIGYLTETNIGVGKPVMDWICQPVEQELQQLYDRRLDQFMRTLAASKPREMAVEVEVRAVARELAPLLGVKVAEPSVGDERMFRPFVGRLPPQTWRSLVEQVGRVLRPPRLATMSVTEAMAVYFKVTFVCGIVLASPWVFWQIWSFVAAGLYPHEKRYIHRFLPFSLGLFLGGVALCQWVVMPAAVGALLGFNEWLGLEPDLRLSEWLGFTLLMPLVFGISFQTPLVMLLLERLGVLGVDAYRGKRRIAWFVLAVFAAVITPSVDLYSMVFLWVPLGLLYELGILLCRLGRRPAPPDEPSAGTVGV
ncbi:MAG TPA: twin-arginine translocase subunit TatC [Gemmataceae bacterium]|nr:twin-arginine translocase subunit TatC [Gemmataceae bacterium]